MHVKTNGINILRRLVLYLHHIKILHGEYLKSFCWEGNRYFFTRVKICVIRKTYLGKRRVEGRRGRDDDDEEEEYTGEGERLGGDGRRVKRGKRWRRGRGKGGVRIRLGRRG